MAKWTVETADQSPLKTGGTTVQRFVPPGLPAQETFIDLGGHGIITETVDTLGGGRPMILPPAPLENNGCTSGCGVPYPNSSPGTAVPIHGAGSSTTVKAADTVTSLLAGWKDWPWWVWLVIGLVVLLLVRR